MLMDCVTALFFCLVRGDERYRAIYRAAVLYPPVSSLGVDIYSLRVSV